VAAQAKAQAVQYQQITRALPTAPTTGDNLKRAVEIAEAVREKSREPMPALAIVADALMTSPAVMLHEIGWKFGLQDIEKGGDPSAASAPPKPAVATTDATPPVRHQSAYVNGEIKPFSGDYRAAIQAVHVFAERLRAHPLIAQVRASKMPLDVSPRAALSGDTKNMSRSEAGPAEFELLIVFKPVI
jgi:hypothetical protein